MALGAVSCPASQARALALAIRALKRKHKLADGFEIKWVKVSPAQTAFYLDLVNLFFDTAVWAFRGVVIPDKEVLRHETFQQTHDQWYYKMYYLLLKPIPTSEKSCRIYIDVKDTCGGEKVRLLQNILRTKLHDVAGTLVANIQQVHSREVSGLQLADFLIGALSYLHRNLSGNSAKLAIIGEIKKRSNLTLKWSTAPGRAKFDLFIWETNREDAPA
jgi:hypothetical protein